MDERLTHRDSKGDVWIKDAAHVDEQGQICMLSDRLAAYEDSGLSPEQVRELAEAKAEGRIVILPVSIGRPIWRFHRPAGCPPFIEPGKMKYCDLDWWGRGAFETREAAEKAIVEVGK